MTDQPDLKARVAALEAQVRVAYGFDRDAVFANLDRQTARITELEAERDQARRLVTEYMSGERAQKAAAQAAESRLALAQKVVEAGRKILAADREALADHRPKWGIADAVDNNGKPYQSQWFADTLSALSAALTAYEEGGGASRLQGNQDDA